MNTMNKAIKIFYDQRQSVKGNTSFSPSAGKPEEVVAAWLAEFNVDVVSFDPVTRAEFKRVHKSKFIDGVLDLRRSNGFSNKLPEVAASLPWTAGSIRAAALYALQTGLPAASPTSGFHHSGWKHGGGFCTFNGLMVAAMACKDAGAQRVGILDLDEHYGDGTADIIRKLDAKWIHHYTYGEHHVRPEVAEAWLADLEQTVRDMFDGCDVVIFQAGADPHINDPLGGDLTTEQMARRDRIVFETLNDMGIPVAWNLAGGYQTPLANVIEIHRNTMAECLAVHGTE